MNTSTMIRVAKTIELRISPDALKMTAAGVWTMADWAFCRKMMLFSMDTPSIPLLAEEGWRDSLIEAGAPGAKREPDRAKPQLVVSSARRVAGLTTVDALHSYVFSLIVRTWSRTTSVLPAF